MKVGNVFYLYTKILMGYSKKELYADELFEDI